MAPQRELVEYFRSLELGIRVPDQVSDFADGSTALLHACEVGF